MIFDVPRRSSTSVGDGRGCLSGEHSVEGEAEARQTAVELVSRLKYILITYAAYVRFATLLIYHSWKRICVHTCQAQMKSEWARIPS